MPSNSTDQDKEKIAGFQKAVGTLESAFKSIKDDFATKKLDKEELEGKKVNFLEDIKKTTYEINQFKEKFSARNEKEKLILEEFNLLSNQFQTDIDEDTGIATIYLSASMDSHFEIDVDCSPYPNTPYIFIPKELDDFFEGSVVTQLKSLKRWSIKKPPHLVDIIKELEEKLVEYFMKDNELMEDREKIATRRKLIESARTAEKEGNIEEALIIYRDILKISKELKDKQNCLKYEDKIREMEQTASQK